MNLYLQYPQFSDVNAMTHNINPTYPATYFPFSQIFLMSKKIQQKKKGKTKNGKKKKKKERENSEEEKEEGKKMEKKRRRNGRKMSSDPTQVESFEASANLNHFFRNFISMYIKIKFSSLYISYKCFEKFIIS